MATQLGFDLEEVTLVATPISEVAPNIVDYASPGEIFLQPIRQGNKAGMQMLACDAGPGIGDVDWRFRQSRKSKGDLLRDPLRLPIFKTVQSLAHQNSNAHGVGCMKLAPCVADLVEDVLTRSKLI